MQLYHNSISPFCRMVDIVLLETGQHGDVTPIASGGNPLVTDASPIEPNPLGKIPALVRDDGPTIYDSRVICRYFNDLGNGTLYPATRLWETLTLEATGHGMTEATVLMVYEARFRSAEMQSPEWIEGQWSKVARALDAAENLWISHLSGPLDIGHIAVGCALGYIDLRVPERNWRNGRPELASWFADFSDRPSAKATFPQAQQ